LGKGAGGILLKLANLYSTFVSGLEVARASAESSGGAHSTSGKTNRVFGENVLGSAVKVAIGDALDERLDVNVGGAAICARCVGTSEATLRFDYCRSVVKNRPVV